VSGRNTKAQHVSELGVNRDWFDIIIIIVVVANRNAFAISGVFLAACNGFDATSNHPHYLFLFPQLSNLYTHTYSLIHP
jgi:hypothetical protein